MAEDLETMLTGGHPNSLGRTIEVVDTVFANPERVEDLYACYRSADEVVRLRVSNGMRRVQAERPDLIVPFYDRLIDEIGQLDQASAQWTLAKLFEVGRSDMTEDQVNRAEALMRRNLAEHGDWIVLNNTMETLALWSREKQELHNWLLPHLNRLSKDPRKSVSKRAQKLLKKLAN
ncbi:MAG: hypothetical protein AAF393_06540 [Pseudomonadota bacterium]